jgi:hypothetical protein
MIPTFYFLFNYSFSPLDETCLIIGATVLDDLVVAAKTC